ncbi:hypothetical protein Q4504_00625 [Mesomycoplasma ovipneumoniae]|uniref:hypothetical protein n=1 Tax=Mesomycoplasma ovipneumoniae TaxID=29562 RepID=UPI0026E227D9|nr:hypothetical protein [Mesomycoplasma ovipneumoniae]MDO6856973.1 hypothetical protein [Mesomycoplasma ovipneumoniae]
MSNIIKLELKNLSDIQKEELFLFLRLKCPKRMKFAQEISAQRLDNENLKKYNFSDKNLESYFKYYLNHFIAFQEKYKNSLYSQAIQRNNFKGLSFEDIVENLNQDQKDKKVRYIRLKVKYLKDENGNHFYEDPSLENFTNKDRDNIEKIENMSEKKKQVWEENKNNKYVLVKLLNEEDRRIEFFKNEDELILFALKNQELAPWMLRYHGETLNPHYKINKLIEKYHLPKIVKKDGLEPKMNPKKWKKLIRVLEIIVFLIGFPFLKLWLLFESIVLPLLLRLGRFIRGFLVIVAIGVRIIHLLIDIFG